MLCIVQKHGDSHHNNSNIMEKMLVIFITFVTIFLIPDATVDAALPFKDQCIKWHNEFRRRHQVGPVTWSGNLAKGAQVWADHLADNNLFEHDQNTQAGENLYLSSHKPVEPCTTATKAFYDEVKYYDYNKPGFSQRTGHFTQIVWKNTKEIGAAYATRRDGRFVLVIRYSPPGNYLSMFRQNVLPIEEETTATATMATSAAPGPARCCSLACKVLVIISAITVKFSFWY